MGDVYEMLNYIFDANFYTHQLPTAMRTLEEENPEWFQEGVSIINDIKHTNNTNDVTKLIELIDKDFPSHQIELGKIDSEIKFMAGLENLVLKEGTNEH